MAQKRNKEDEVSAQEYLEAKLELEALRKEHGIEPPEEERVKEGKISHLISGFFERQDARQKVKVSRKKLLLLAVFTGWMGGHRFYLRQYKLGIAYLLFCWTGVPIAMTLIDLMQFIPIPPDEEGNILV